MEERRHANRQVVHQPIIFDCLSCGTDEEFRGEMLNMSPGGAAIRTGHAVEKNQVVRMRRSGVFLAQPQYGSVVWIDRTDSAIRAGLRFMTENEVNALNLRA